MHIEIIDDFNMIIYLNNNHIKSIDFNKKEDLENYFKTLFVKLREHYDIDINGFYNINAYKDKNYGLVLELEKEDIDYMDYFNGQVDMNIIFENNSVFLYEIDDYFNIDKKILNKINIYKYNEKIYLQIIDDISEINMGKILEFSKIIYNDKRIIKHGTKIEPEYLII